MAPAITPAEHAKIWQTFHESPLAVKTMLAGVFVNRIGGFLNIFLVLFLVARGHSIGQATFALGIYGAGAVGGLLIGGVLADRLGARDATVISMGSTGALTAALLYLPDYSLLLAAVALVGLLGQIYRPASATLLSELTPAHRQVMMFAMYRFGLNLGSTAAPLIGYALYNLDGQRYALLFWVEALIALGYAVLAYLTMPARPTPPTSNLSVDDGSRGGSIPPADGRGGSVPPAGSPARTAGGYLAVLRDGRYVMYLIGSFFSSAVYVQYLSTLPLDVNAAGLAIFWYTFAVSLNGLLVIAFELLVTKVSQRWPIKVCICLSFGLVGLGMAGYGLPMGPAVIIAATLVWTMGEIVGGPAVFAYAATTGPAHLRGRYIGGFQFVFGLGTAVGPMVGGALFLQLGHSVWPALAVGEAIALALALAGVRNPSRSPRRDTGLPASTTAP